jgi:hypothetical protein
LIFRFSNRNEFRYFRISRRINDKIETHKVRKRVRTELIMNKEDNPEPIKI